MTYDAAGRELTRRIGETITLDHTFDALGRLTEQSVTGRAVAGSSTARTPTAPTATSSASTTP